MKPAQGVLAHEPDSAPTGPWPGLPAEPATESPSAETSIPPGGSHKGKLPIEDVLAHLHAHDAANRAPVTPPPPAPRRRPAWDFMDDEPFEDDPVPRPERTRAPDSIPAATAPPPADREVEPASRKAGGLPAWWRSVRPAVHDFFSGPAEPRPMLVAGLALALAAAVAVALGLYWAGNPAPGPSAGSPGVSAVPGGGEAGEGSDLLAAPAPQIAPGLAETTEGQEAVNGAATQEVAYVDASLLICRDAPDHRARRVRNLLRGREVRVLGYDGAWASLDYRGAQCWAQVQYLSPVRPF